MRMLIVAGAALLACGLASAQEMSGLQAVLDRFLATSDEPFERCFGDMPGLQGPGASAEFQVGDGGSSPRPMQKLVLVVDVSGSMAGRFGSQAKIDVARQLVDDLLAGLPDPVATGLVVFGHKGSNDEAGRAESCAGIEPAVRPASGSAERIRAQLDLLTPTGWTPLAAAIDLAGQDLDRSASEGEQVIYVVSDGKETCGGDPVATARALNSGPARVVVNVLGFDLPAEDRAELEAIAAAGGGLFTEVRDKADTRDWLDALQRRNANFAAMLRKENDAFITQLTNDNKVAISILSLRNCVNGTILRQSNGFSSAMRKAGEDQATVGSARALLDKRHDAQRARVDAIEATARAALAGANDAVQDDLEDARGRYDEAVPPSDQS